MFKLYVNRTKDKLLHPKSPNCYSVYFIHTLLLEGQDMTVLDVVNIKSEFIYF